MAEFGASATLTVEVDESSLREARADVEDGLSDVSVGAGGGGGATSIADGGADLASLADERNDLLEDIHDELQQGVGGGGGLLGGGGGGGGGLDPLSFLAGSGASGRGLGILKSVGALAALPALGGGAAVASGKADTVGGGIAMTSPLLPLLGLGSAGADFLGGVFDGSDTTTGPDASMEDFTGTGGVELTGDGNGSSGGGDNSTTVGHGNAEEDRVNTDDTPTPSTDQTTAAGGPSDPTLSDRATQQEFGTSPTASTRAGTASDPTLSRETRRQEFGLTSKDKSKQNRPQATVNVTNDITAQLDIQNQRELERFLRDPQRYIRNALDIQAGGRPP